MTKPLESTIARIINADAADALKYLQPDSIDLIVTSPPYANQRSKTYGGVQPDQYVDWFMPIADSLLQSLKPTGTFILNIKELAVNHERHPYVLDLILQMNQSGWRWTEQHIWAKTNSYPGKWPNRFRDSYERLLQFNKSQDYRLYPDPDQEQPENFLPGPTETANKQHSAAFPYWLPKYFINLFTQPEDIVLDPFLGSGTTALAALDAGRNAIGIDSDPQYCRQAADRIKSNTTAAAYKVTLN